MTPSNIPLQEKDITEEEWTIVLRLSSMWEFFDMRKLAIEELSRVAMNPMTRISLARQYNIQKWLFAGYEELAKRTEPISIAEAEQLVLEKPFDRTHCDCVEGIRRAFAKELRDALKFEEEADS